MIDFSEYEYKNLDSAIRAGSDFYFDKDIFEKEGKSGGSICPKCKKRTSSFRKRKFPMLSWIHDCESCEIKDEFRRMWHGFNKNCSDYERTMHNNWLHQIRGHLNEENSRDKLKELIEKIPFFEV